jgi:hypothetical protein
LGRTKQGRDPEDIPKGTTAKAERSLRAKPGWNPEDTPKGTMAKAERSVRAALETDAWMRTV